MPVIDRPAVSLGKIMYATDFSPVAERAGEYVRALATRFGSTVEVAHAFHSVEDTSSLPITEMRKQHTQRLAESLHEFQAAGIETRASQSSEYPLVGALLLLERQFGPDLMVMGTTSKSALDRFLLGSTAEHLIREALCPVLTVGPNAKPPKKGSLVFERIVLAADFSDASNKAAGLALALAADSGAHLSVVHVTPDGKANGETQERAFREELSRLVPEAADDWCALEYNVEHGNPAQAILNIANKANADLIVMGARHRSFSLLHLHRGVTQDVLAQASCPVLTVH